MTTQPLNTYRVYLLDTTNALQPVTTVVYIKAPKYGDAWKQGRALASRSADEGTEVFTTEPGGGETFTVTNKETVVAKVTDMTTRNVKLDKNSLQAILTDESLSPEEKLAAMAQFTGGMPAPTPSPAPTPDAAPAAKASGKGAKSEGAAAA